MNMISKLHDLQHVVQTPALVLGMLAFVLPTVAPTADAALIVEEHFDFAPGASGNVNGLTTTGTGFLDTATDSWSSSFTTNAIVVDTGLSYSTLLEAGESVKRAANQGNAEMSRQLSTDSVDDLTGDNTEIWFSVLLNTAVGSSDGNVNGTLAIGTGALIGGDRPPTMAAGNSSIGVGFNTRDRIEAFSFGATPSLDTGSLSTSEGTTYLIVGKINWAVNGSDDVLRLFNITNLSNGEPANDTEFAKLEIDLDQSTFNTLAIGDRQQTFFDEIRFGDTYADVTPVPEPSTFVLAALGLLGLLACGRRRKR